MNTRIELSEDEIEDTIIHEMIHYYIGYNQLEDTSAHGAIFQQVMNAINEKYGRHLSISHKSSKSQKEQAVDKNSITESLLWFASMMGEKVSRFCQEYSQASLNIIMVCCRQRRFLL